jgi:hypothetical protein
MGIYMSINVTTLPIARHSRSNGDILLLRNLPKTKEA